MSVLYVAGFGCRRGCSEASLRTLLDSALREHGLCAEQIDGLATIDTKRAESGLSALAQTLGLALTLLPAAQLAMFAPRLTHRSQKVLENTGIAGVAEAAALALAETLAQSEQQGGQRAELIIEKRKNADATFALAKVFFGQ
jgi:cobalt-precorrin 5A hydrolase